MHDGGIVYCLSVLCSSLLWCILSFKMKLLYLNLKYEKNVLNLKNHFYLERKSYIKKKQKYYSQDFIAKFTLQDKTWNKTKYRLVIDEITQFIHIF